MRKADQIDADHRELLADPTAKKKSGIYEYLLGGKEKPNLLNVRPLDDATQRKACDRQTQGRQGPRAKGQRPRASRSARCAP